MQTFRDEGAATPPNPASIGQALGALLRDPWRKVVLRWNAKAAMLSAMFRGAVFLAASVASHRAGLSHGVMAEALFGAASAGFFGTLTQALRFAEPQWASELLLAGVFPLMFQLGDISFHVALGTAVFHAGLIASAVLTIVSSAFNLYIMRRGTLLVGDEGNPFVKDLVALPRLALMFVISAVLKAWRIVMGIGRAVCGDTLASS